MALVVKDRVKEVTTTTGTSNLTLGGAVYGFQSFSVIGNGNTTYYGIYDSATGDWEVGVGTYSTTGPTLSRDTVLESSNSGSKVVFGAGTKDVFVTYPAERSVYLDAAGSAVTVLDVGTLGVSTANISTANITAGTISTTPTSSNDLVNKTYVDAIAAQGISYHTPVKYEVPDTTGNLNATYNNGTGGVGATLTNAGTQAPFAPDGPTAQVGDRILIYNQTNAAQNGVYQVTVVGTASTNWVLTRTSDTNTYGVKDPNALGAGDAFYVTSGNTGAGETYVCNTAGTITFGTTAITFAQISSAQVYSAGAGLTLSNLQFSITPVGTANTYGSSSSVPVFTTNAYGQVTSVTNTGIAISAGAVSGLAPSATTDTTNASNITSGTLGSARLTGSYTGITGVGTLTAGTWNASTIGAAYGGTGITSYTVGDILYADGSTSLAKLADVATGNALLSGGVGTAPAWGKIGLQTHVSGTLQVTNGGTGATTLTGYVYGNGTGAFTASTSIPNSATTATSANTASAIVARDGSGNFSAGTITASLSGNASTATTATSATTATNLAGGTAGAIPYQSGSGTTLFSAAGTSGQYLQSNGTSAPSWSTLPTVGDGTLTLNTSGTGLSGSATFTANQSGNTTFTVTSNATSGNTGSTIVARDGSGNFSAGTITATLSGNATTATTATNWGSYGAVPAAGTSFANANTIGRSDANGYTYFNYINSNTSNSENPTVSQVIVTNGGDNFYRKASIAHLTSSLSGTAPINISGTAAFATNLSTNRTNWSTNGTISAVVGQLAWKNYGNGHTIFDASNSTAPDGTSISNTNPQAAWAGTYPTLMGWNGTNTYGVRVDSARVSDSAGSVDYNNLTNKTGGTGTYTTSGDYRAPIFYDSNNTAYYVDPASTSVLTTVLAGASSWYIPASRLIVGSGSGTTTAQIAWESNSYYTGAIAMTSAGAFVWGGQGNSTWDFRVNCTYNGDYSASGSSRFSINASGDTTSASSSRAPIFYDSDNTGYYVDPASTSNLWVAQLLNGKWYPVNNNSGNSIDIYVRPDNNNTYVWRHIYGGTGTGYGTGVGGYGIYAQHLGGDYSLLFNPTGFVTAPYSFRSPIFYDSDNTGYYIDPASTSNLNKVYYNSNMVSSNYGIGQVGFYSSYRYQAVFSMGEAYLLPADGTTTGNLYGMAWSHPNAGGIAGNLNSHGLLLLQNGSFMAALSTNGTFSADVRGTIFYDYNNTGYYCDPNSNSRLNQVLADGGTFYGATYFQSNQNTTGSGPPLQAYSNNGSGAIMSFHRGGYYAVNMGLDNDNVIRIGGWSAAANRLQMDMSGNLTMAGNVTAYSDEKLKKDWADLSDDFIERLASVKAGTYTRIDSGERQAGSSAQDWQELLPEVVSEDAAGTLALAYGNAAVVACVELAKSVVALRAEIKALRAQ